MKKPHSGLLQIYKTAISFSKTIYGGPAVAVFHSTLLSSPAQVPICYTAVGCTETVYTADYTHGPTYRSMIILVTVSVCVCAWDSLSEQD